MPFPITTMLEKRSRGRRARALARMLALLVMPWWPAASQTSAPVPAVPSSAPNDMTVMVVIDASGSMWGKLARDRTAKILHVRKAVTSALADLPATTRMGLVAFGHRRLGCTDVQTLRAPAPGGVDEITEHLDDLNPRGRGPVTLALRQAMEALPEGRDPATLVLIHDDLDNCGQDVCSIVGPLKEKQPGIVIHVVSIGMKPGDAQRMRCLTEGTGGRHHVVADGEEIAAALRQATLSRTVPRPEPGSPAPAAQDSAPTPAPPSGLSPQLPGLHLIALLGEAASAAHLPVRWRITPLAGGSTLWVPLRTGGELFEPLPAGRYRIEATLDALVATREIDVLSDRPTRIAVSLPGGALVYAPGRVAGAPVGGKDVPLISVRALPPEDSSRPDSRPETWLMAGTRRELALPAGRYEVTQSLGAVMHTDIAEVVLGTRRQIAARAETGIIELSAIGRDGGPPLDDVLYLILEDDPDAPLGRREIARSAAPQARFTLAAGTYHVVVRRGAAETRTRIAVGPGETTRRTLLLDVAEITLALPENAVALGLGPEDVRWRIAAIGEGRNDVWMAYSAESHLFLPPGSYRIEARFGDLNAISTREVTLTAGARQRLALQPQAAVMSLRLAAGAATPSDTHWQVKSGDGRLIWSATEASPAVLLQQGDYVIEVQTRLGRRTLPIEVRSGESRVVELAAPGD